MARLVVLLVLFAVGVNVGHTLAATRPSLSSTLDALLKITKDVAGFKERLNTIDARLTTLEMNIVQKPSSGDSRCWVRNIADAVRAVKYRAAEQELIELNNDDLIPSIVRDLFAGSAENVDVILDFARSLKSAETKFLVLSALHDEMRSSGNSDPLKLIVLVNEVERLSRKEEKASGVIAAIKKDIKTAAVRRFKAAMIANKFKDSEEVDQLTDALYDLGLDGLIEVMEEVIDKVFGVVAAETIIDNICGSKYTQLVITGLGAVFNRFNFAGNLNNDIILKLASNLEKLQERENYASLSKDRKDDVDDLVRRLPTCVRNLFFARSVCLWNKGRNMFLYASDPSENYVQDRHKTFLYGGGEPRQGAYWNVQRNGSDILFRNIHMGNEFLYVAGVMYDREMRHVFTWGANLSGYEQSAWSIELDGDYCYLQSRKYKEYLFATSLIGDDKSAFALTSITGKGVKSAPEYQWQLRNCSRTPEGKGWF